MSSRLSTPISKLTRSLSTSAPVARPSHLLNNGSKSAAAVARKPSPKAVAEESEPSTTSTRAHSTASTPHRPVLPPQPTTFRFMQTFHHSAPKPFALSQPTVDALVLPNLAAEAVSYDPYSNIRVPLLPDNFAGPPAGTRAPEASDLPLSKPEILVVAANPEQVLPSALTEVEGMGVDGVELKFAHWPEEAEQQESFEMGQGMIRDLWKGLVDDLAGGKKPAF
ncbi:hypothetical protein QBC35DRAFT_14144 [Podospora australis]|uniref:Uncharacterized protein n=1 Tax=Podospora australis TaxID=1536484 RepID=A0AAN6X4Y8_9PEZI|nr:hypothetical protein QBC35DRAFT_14144 [Podospora australis]